MTEPRNIEFVKMGDFYEVIGDDAPIVAAKLGIVVTSRKGVPMCGVPYHSFETYKEALGPEFTIKVTKTKKFGAVA